MKIKTFEFNMFPVNCYVVWDEETLQAAVIDAGCYYQEEQQTLKKFIAENGLTVTHLLNTHLHLDHIFGNAFMLREFGVSAEAGKEDEFLLPRTAEYCRMFGFPLNEEPPALGGYVHDGDLIKIGNIELKALAVPGHSPGSMVFYCEAQHCMFSGDDIIVVVLDGEIVLHRLGTQERMIEILSLEHDFRTSDSCIF